MAEVKTLEQFDANTWDDASQDEATTYLVALDQRFTNWATTAVAKLPSDLQALATRHVASCLHPLRTVIRAVCGKPLGIDDPWEHRCFEITERGETLDLDQLLLSGHALEWPDVLTKKTGERHNELAKIEPAIYQHCNHVRLTTAFAWTFIEYRLSADDIGIDPSSMVEPARSIHRKTSLCAIHFTRLYRCFRLAGELELGGRREDAERLRTWAKQRVELLQSDCKSLLTTLEDVNPALTRHSQAIARMLRQASKLTKDAWPIHHAFVEDGRNGRWIDGTQRELIELRNEAIEWRGEAANSLNGEQKKPGKNDASVERVASKRKPADLTPAIRNMFERILSALELQSQVGECRLVGPRDIQEGQGNRETFRRAKKKIVELFRKAIPLNGTTQESFTELCENNQGALIEFISGILGPKKKRRQARIGAETADRMGLLTKSPSVAAVDARIDAESAGGMGLGKP